MAGRAGSDGGGSLLYLRLPRTYAAACSTLAGTIKSRRAKSASTDLRLPFVVMVNRVEARVLKSAIALHNPLKNI